MLNDLGITHVEFRSAWGINVLDLTDEQIDEVAALLAAHDLAVSSIGSPIGKINIEDDFDAHLVRADRALAVARRLGAPFIRIFSFFLRPDQAPEQHRDEVLRRMRALADEGRAHRRRAAAREREGHLRRRPGPRARHRRVGRLARPAAGLGPRQLRAGAASPRSPTATRRCARTPSTSRSRTRCWPPATSCPAGEGDGQVRETVRALAADGFDGFFSMEPHLGHLQRVRRALRADELHPRHPRVHRHSRQRRDRLRMSTQTESGSPSSAPA